MSKFNKIIEKLSVDNPNVEQSQTARIVQAIYDRWGWDVSNHYWSNDYLPIHIHWSNPRFDLEAKMQGNALLFCGDVSDNWTDDLEEAIQDAVRHRKSTEYKLKND